MNGTAVADRARSGAYRAWRALPAPARRTLHPLAFRAARRLGVVATAPEATVDDTAGSTTITSLEAVDEKLAEIERAAAISDDEMRKVFQTFRMEFPIPLPDDPFDPEYRKRQFEVYRHISGRSAYAVDNEQSGFEVDPRRPFPYYTESYDTVGHHIMALGNIILTMALPAGARILEMGMGWGNTTISLARMGYDVTAVDVDPNFVELVNARARLLGLGEPARRSTFLEIDQIGASFDAVLFYECFHHCSDHLLLLEKLHSVLAPGGRVFFAAEPISDDFPMPWGVRLDGESVWAIRQFGWLELGFRESYFREALDRCGYDVERHVNPATHLGVVFEATPRASPRVRAS